MDEKIFSEKELALYKKDGIISVNITRPVGNVLGAKVIDLKEISKIEKPGHYWYKTSEDWITIVITIRNYSFVSKRAKSFDREADSLEVTIGSSTPGKLADKVGLNVVYEDDI